MIDDIRAMVWKERKSLFRFRGSRTRFIVILASPLLLVIYTAIERGGGFGDDFLAVIIAVFIPAILVTTTIPDSIAGERERRTLTTLLASRLPDSAILTGKLAVSIAFSWGLTLGILAVGLITATITETVKGKASIVLFSPTIGVSSVALSLLVAVLISSAGVMVSLRARSVQEAAQLLTALTILPPMILGMLVTLLLPRFSGTIEDINWNRVIAIVLVVLFAANVLMLRVVISQFHRFRLLDS